MTTPGSGIATLPPIGMIGETDHADVATYIDALVQEAVQGRDGWVEVADRSITIYTYGSDPAPDDETIIVPDIQNQVQATTDVQTKEKPSVTLEPVEKGEPPICFWAGPQDLGILPAQSGGLGLATNQVADWIDEQGEQQPPVPIDEEQADQIRELITAGGITTIDPAGAMRLRKIKPQWLVEVNDQFVADFYQGIFDIYWTRSGTDEGIRANLLSTNILGWTLWLYEFDGDEQRHLFREMSIRQMYIDPTVRDIRFASYAGAELLLDREEAKKLHPQIADVIQAEAQIGVPTKDSNVTWGQAVDRDFQRPVISMRTFWLRNQPCPYQPEDAIKFGKVEQRDVLDEQAWAAMQAAMAPAIDEEGEGTAGGLDEMTGDNYPESDHGDDGDLQLQPDGAEAGAGLSVDDGHDRGEGGIQPLSVEPIEPPTRPAYFAPGSDEEIHPAHPTWPTYRWIRQITLIGSRVVQDKPCDFFDIPVLHNVNRPIPQRPFGQGEPYVLWKLQNAKSRVLQSMVDHTEYYGHPATCISTSMAAELEERYEDAHVMPGRTLIVDDELYKQFGGNIHTIIQPPAMGEGLMQVYPIVSREMDNAGGYSDAMRGQATPDVKSGKMLESMQAAGASIMGFKAARTGDMIERLARHQLHSLVHRLDVDDILRVNRKYPRHIVEAIVKHAREIEWNVNVTIAAGNGAVMRQKKEQARADRQLGAISLQTFREAGGIDSRQEDQRMEAEAEKMARMQSRLAPAMPAAPPPA